MRKVLLLLILLTGLAPTALAATVKTTHRTIPSWDGTPSGPLSSNRRMPAVAAIRCW